MDKDEVVSAAGNDGRAPADHRRDGRDRQGAYQDPVDLDNCAREPIHVPGAIQPHGVLLALSEPDLVVRVASANVDEWFGRSADAVVGAPVAAVIGDDATALVGAAAAGAWVQRIDDLELLVDRAGGPQAVSASLHRTGGHLVLEFEVDLVSGRHVGALLRDATTALQRARTVRAVADAGAAAIRSVTGFDRVMVYRFDEEWNGEVIAEQRADHLNTFLGLHYPSTDIPAQARELYRQNWIRLIPDIGYDAVPLWPAVAHDSPAPLDLGLSTLRSVSPIHVEYLSNMGVTASMSVSIIIDGELWGLIACHHYSGVNRPTVVERNTAEFLGQLISLRVAETASAADRAEVIELGAVSDSLGAAFAGASLDAVAAVLRSREADVLKLAGATGAVMLWGGEEIGLGLVPPPEVVDRLRSRWADHGRREVSTVSTATVDAAFAPYDAVACGALSVPLTDDWRDAIIWFRPEFVRTVDWGGDPHNAKLAVAEGDDVRLSPRKSFDRWRETVRGRSQPWRTGEVRAAVAFGQHVGAVLLRREREAAAFADDFQRTMLPDRLPDVDGYLLDSSYAPAAGRVGGDWYDALVIGEDSVAALIGDIAGHGLDAASEMAQLRNAFRAHLLDAESPGAALDRLNDFMVRVMPRSMATVVCVLLTPSTGAVSIAHAGHLPALHTTPAGSSFVETGGNPLLGLRSRARTDVRLDLLPGSSLVLYSDGLIERRGEPLDDGLARLRSVGSSLVSASPQPGVAAELAATLTGPEPDDDVTVLVIARLARNRSVP